MNKGLINTLILLVILLLSPTAFAQGDIYKVVDKDGNVTFTDQAPNDAAQPLDLPPLSVIETDIQVPETTAAGSAADEPKPPTIRQLKNPSPPDENVRRTVTMSSSQSVGRPLSIPRGRPRWS